MNQYYYRTSFPGDDKMMNQMTATNSFRFTSISGGNSLGAYVNGNSEESSNVTGQIGVDEFVLNGHNGTLATFQDPPALLSLLNGNDSCSFII